ncbi:MAG: ribonuclease HI, partial [Clostridia bacterium]|nr:ribonuclease HI [Clostridia bacterium]
AYVVNAFNQKWLSNWQRNNWKTSGKGEVLNKDLWQRLLKVVEKHNVEFIKVKGHSDNENNNRCDALAREEILKLQD